MNSFHSLDTIPAPQRPTSRVSSIRVTATRVLTALSLAFGLSAPLAAALEPVNLGSMASFVIVSGAAITTTGGGVIVGDVGASPIAGSAIGLECAQVVGTIYAVDASGPPCAVIDPAFLTTVKGDLTIAYNDAAGRTPIPSGPNLNPGLIPGSGNIGGMTLAPGLYKFTTTALITGSDLTLSGAADDVWIFQCAQDLQLASGIKVILAGGAQAKNVFWQVGTSAVLGTSSVFMGTIIADQAITMQTSSTLNGRALAFSAGVTFNGVGATVSLAPEIVVEQPLGMDVADGDTSDFGPVLLGSTQDFIYTVRNTGDADLDLSLPILITGLDASQFSVTVPPTTPVLPGGSTSFTVRFAPLTDGIKVADLQFANNDSDENPFDLELTGMGALVPVPEIVVEQPVGMNVADGGFTDFGPVLVGSTADLIFTVRNTGNADLTLMLPIIFSGLDAASFTVTVPPTSPVLAGGSTTFTVRFAPLTDGIKVAALQFGNNDSNENPFDINLTGTAELVPVPEIVVEQPVGINVADGGTTAFGPVLVGSTADLIFTIRNTGNADLTLSLPITFTGLNASLFTVTVPPTSPVLAGGSTTFTVRFAPLTAGNKVAALQFGNNDSNENPFDINLTGTAALVPVPEIVVEQPVGVNVVDGGAVDFGPVLVGSTQDLLFTVRNTGNANLILTLPITFSGLDASLFTVTVPPTSPVVAGGSTTFTVRFAPLTAGNKVAALQLGNNDSNENPFDIILTGTATLVPVPEIVVEQPVNVNVSDGGAVDFGAVLVGSTADLLFTVRNTGNADLTLALPITFSGLDASLFTVTVPPTSPVVAGGSTTFTVRFAPLTAGGKVAALQLGNNDSNENPFDSNLTGTGALVPVPEIVVEQPVNVNVADGGAVDFGAVLVGSTADLLFTVRNAGNADLTLALPITFSGLDAALFTVTVPPTSPVVAGGSTTFTVRFAPLTAGGKVAALQLGNNDSNENPFDIILTGTGALVPVPEIVVEQPVNVNVSDGGAVDFGAVLVGSTADLLFTVRNAGNADLTLALPITFSGLDAALFTVTVPPTSPVVAGGSTTFTVRFAPLTAGGKVAALQLGNNDSNENPFDINLTGTAALVPVPEIVVEQPVNVNVADGGVINFGLVPVGSTADRVFTIRNTGDANLTVAMPITFSGLDASLFTVTAPPTSPVVAGGSTTFTVRFAPLTAGGKVAALQIGNNDSNENPFDINLTATATAPEIAVEQPAGTNVADGSTFAFGPVLVGTTTDRVFTVRNTGSADLSLTLPITFSGADASLFTVTAPPTSPVVAGASTTFTVRFAPLTPGAKVAALQFGNNDSDENPFDINLTATATAPEIAVEQPAGTNVADGSTFAFGPVLVGTTTDRVFTVRNTGTADLSLTLPITFSGADASLFTVTAPPTSPVVAGASTTFTVRFAPLTPGAKVAALQFGNNDSDENPFDINLTATATAPEIVVEQPAGTNVADGGTFAFGPVLVGTTADRVFTVRNTGTANLTLTLPITFSGADASLFTVTAPPTTPVVAGASTTFTVRFAPLTGGAKVAALQLGNNDSDENPFDINLTGTGTGLFVLSASPITLNPQTGLFEQTVRLTNTDPVTVAAVRLLIQSLPADVQVYNVTGTVGGVPYVQHDFPLAQGGEVVFMIEYYRVSRQPIPQPVFVVQSTAAVTPAANGTVITIDRNSLLSGRFLIEFPTVPGARYAVQYSTNMTVWQTANPPITAPANRVQWYDDGPPKTISKPTSVNSRFYRVIRLP